MFSKLFGFLVNSGRRPQPLAFRLRYVCLGSHAHPWAPCGYIEGYFANGKQWSCALRPARSYYARSES